MVLSGPSAATVSLPFLSSLSGPFPKTDMKEGRDASSDCELDVTGMLDS